MLLTVMAGVAMMARAESRYLSQLYLVDTLKLNTAYRELVKAPEDTARQRAFFEAFPSSGREFMSVYGAFSPGQYPFSTFEELAKGGDVTEFDSSMSSQGFDHVNAFKTMLPSIPDSLYLAKMINIGVDLDLDADGSALFWPDLMQGIIPAKADMAFRIIKDLTPLDQMKFWLFYCSSWLKGGDTDKHLRALVDRMQAQYPKECATALIALEHANGHAPESPHYHIGARRYQGEGRGDVVVPIP